jgi:hypothetical protein
MICSQSILLSDQFALNFLLSNFLISKFFALKKITLIPYLVSKSGIVTNLFMLVRIKPKNHKQVQDLSVCLHSAKTTSFTKL